MQNSLLVTQNLYEVLANHYCARGTKIGVICQIAFIAAAWLVFSENIRFRGRMRFAESREPSVKYHEYKLTSTLVGSGAEITLYPRSGPLFPFLPHNVN